MPEELPTGLSMLWEPVDPGVALRERFGFPDLPALARWTTATLATTWGLSASDVTRVVVSDTNTIAWVTTDAGDVVVKASCDASRFERLAASTQLITLLGENGVPVAAPLRTAAGRGRRTRVGVEGPVGPLSVCVLPHVPGDWLDVTDLDAVRDAGACLARVHATLAQAPPELHVAATPTASGALSDQVGTWLAEHDNGHVPGASRRLHVLLAEAPDLDDAPQLVHHDVRAANLLVREGRVVAVLDLDAVAVRHRVDDLAKSCTYLATRFTGWAPTPPVAQRALVEGYEAVRPLSAGERAWLEVLLLWQGLVAVSDPDDPAGWAAAARRLSC